MARVTQPVPDILIERAVELWCRALRNPRFENGDNSEGGFFTAGFAAMNSDAAAAKVTEFDDAVERFRGILVAKLKYARDHDGEPTGEQGQYGPKTYYFDGCLRTDYHPEKDLSEAATEAGIPHKLFSWKSSVNLYDPGSVCASFGYGAPAVYHYPLSGNRWLICKLRGEDMALIIKAVEEGRLPELYVEEPAVPANG
ncbi:MULTISPECIES: hypothetical protein [unclassified Rhizobium]|uniref:hypothetical protein n=1 Tax=unclassified Rhizobium TaxID=2613769 RepID=UPI0017830165|nr:MULTISPECIES: hypothetical protein [unclassified Rhizobium]MBD8689345.1 hypothetical protein [Rhizobium sp. CFBP 13644]MBD8693109.1 hypothetical protein [Rhizobium sp. CFBP 13717]